jgi:DNA polymerase-3 subunit epsilon
MAPAQAKKAPPAFVALDFETADRGPDSACSIAMVRVEGSRVVARCRRLIRPPRPYFEFTYIHGITWRDVAGEPGFKEVWSREQGILDGAQFIAAHNAPFDSRVLEACCGRAGIRAPRAPFLCTVRLARKVWNIRPTRLPDVCIRLGLPLKHHDALSDAEACAGIVIAARKAGAEVFPQAKP